MGGAGGSLLLGERRWGDHRGGETARIWAIMISLLLHVGLLYWAGGWLGMQRLRTLDSPFVVSLVAPEQPVVTREVPPVREADAAPTEAHTMPAAEVTPPDGGPGVPEAPVLDETPPPPITPPVTEPVRGETTKVEPELAPPPRRDVAGEATRQLFEQLDELPATPRTLPPIERTGEGEPIVTARPGRTAGIEGPLGERGLLYSEDPPYAEWARVAGIEAEVRFRFWVSSEGNVIRILAIRKSGYPEFESLARAALARWRFEPLPRGQNREEWGEVPIIWQLERPGSTGN